MPLACAGWIGRCGDHGRVKACSYRTYSRILCVLRGLCGENAMRREVIE